MKKRVFKFGAALTAALMVCSATASIAFADEVAEDVISEDTVVEEVVAEEPAADETVAEEPAAEEPADEEEAPVEEVEVVVETEEITEADLAEEEAELSSAVADVDTGSVITLGTISATSDASYYNVTVPFTIEGETAPDQLSFFVYDITAITGDQNNTVGFSAETPVGYINQYDGALSGTYTFKLDKAQYSDNSIIIVKMGGTGITTPDAKSYTLGGSSEGEYAVGDVDHSSEINNRDAILVMRYFMGVDDETALDLSLADVDDSSEINNRDAILIMRYFMGLEDF